MTNQRINLIKFGLTALSFIIALSLEAQDKETLGINRMWGKQKIISRSDIGDKAALFDDGNYAMFIHWGIYSNIANKWKDTTYYGISDWIMSPRRAGISVDDYVAEAKNFNPVNFDAKAIAKLAKDAGMKYIVVTAKHKDGFAMYDSKSNDFNIVKETPFARDPMEELAQACREEGIGLGFYYSHNQDWTFPGGTGGPKTNEKGVEVDFDYYFKEKCLPQINEITTQYGEIAIVWFDSPGNMEKKYVEELVDVVRKNQPNAMIGGRAGHSMGDYLSLADMNIPVRNLDGLWETIDMTNDSWGYAWYDENWKSPKRILKSVISTVGRGGTYMLNVGPKPDGSIPVEAQIALIKAGEWINKYPQIIYGADPSPWGRELSWGDVTVKDEKLSLAIYDWPLDGTIVLAGLNNDIKSANLWVDGKLQSLKTVKKGNWVSIELPANRPEKLISVVEVTVEGELSVDKSISIDPFYPTKLSVEFAKAQGANISDKKWMEKFGEWKNISHAQNWTGDGKVYWEIDILEPGYYQVDLNYAGSSRFVWRVTNSEGGLVQNEQNSSQVYSYYEMGLMRFETSGKHTVSVEVKEGDIESASLKEIRFTPISRLE